MATRRSARLTARAAAEQTLESSQAAQTEQLVRPILRLNYVNIIVDTMMPQKAHGSRASKKQKISNEKAVETGTTVANNPNRKRKRGDSVFMKELPIDVVLEIFGLLEPIDLLHLSRVSKGLHNLLTSSDVTFLWNLVCLILVFRSAI